MSEIAPNTPSIRCPGCGGLVALPAEECPTCHFNFRTGQKPAPAMGQARLSEGARLGAGGGVVDSGGSRNKLALLAGGAAVVIVLVFLLLFLGGEDRAQDMTPPPAAGTGGGPMTIETIRTESPILNPAKPINRSRGVAETADQRVEEMKEIMQE